jgi:hypothetical protein
VELLRNTGYPYNGIDLRLDQVEANRKQAALLFPEDVIGTLG